MLWTRRNYLDMNIKVGSELCDEEYRVIIVHLEWNFIFLAGKDRTLIAYDMDRIKVHVIHAHVIRFCRSRGHFHMNRPYYLPYVLLFMEYLQSSKGAFHVFCRHDSLCSGRQLFSFYVCIPILAC